MYKVSLSALALQHGSAGGDGTGHRRIQADCNPETLTQKTEAVFEECCNEPGEDCSGGIPHSANAGCCAALVPFYRDCAGEMGADAESIREAVALCPTGPAAPTPTATAQRASSVSTRSCFFCTSRPMRAMPSSCMLVFRMLTWCECQR